MTPNLRHPQKVCLCLEEKCSHKVPYFAQHFSPRLRPLAVDRRFTGKRSCNRNRTFRTSDNVCVATVRATSGAKPIISGFRPQISEAILHHRPNPESDKFSLTASISGWLTSHDSEMRERFHFQFRMVQAVIIVTITYSATCNVTGNRRRVHSRIDMFNFSWQAY